MTKKYYQAEQSKSTKNIPHSTNIHLKGALSNREGWGFAESLDVNCALKMFSFILYAEALTK